MLVTVIFDIPDDAPKYKRQEGSRALLEALRDATKYPNDPERLDSRSIGDRYWLCDHVEDVIVIDKYTFPKLADSDLPTEDELQADDLISL